MADAQLKVGLVDHRPIFRAGVMHTLRSDPGLALRWSVATPSEARRRLAASPVDVLLFEVTLDHAADALEFIRGVRAQHADLCVIAVSEDTRTEAAALQVGAAAYLSSEASLADLLGAVHSNGRHGQPPGRSTAGANAAPITRREAEVLREIELGLTNREIAANLNISVTTVNKHVQSILRKVGARNRTQAAGRFMNGVDASF